jgi:oligoribonuclease NrnB/cAMP/cGMP phosphodiesterase (DHH superfamily)
MSFLCIYHADCDDGFAAAWAVRRGLKGARTARFIAGDYRLDPPDVTGCHVIIVDLSYKRPVLEAMAAKAQSVLVLDHHKTAAEDLSGLAVPPRTFEEWWAEIGNRQPPNLAALFDMSRSGAAIAWDFFNPDSHRPRFIEYVQDRDLWTKRLPNVDEFSIALRSYTQDFEVWDDLILRGGTGHLINEGRTIMRYYRGRIKAFKAGAYPGRLGDHPCWISNAPVFAASEVAGELAAEHPDADFGVCYCEVESGVFAYSLRSRGSFDVSEVARKFGGGGHAKAAGFSAPGIVHLRDRKPSA